MNSPLSHTSETYMNNHFFKQHVHVGYNPLAIYFVNIVPVCKRCVLYPYTRMLVVTTRSVQAHRRTSAVSVKETEQHVER